MTFSEEIEDEIKEFVNRTENIYYFPDSDYGVEYLNNNFSSLGTKIDLSKENNYISYNFKKNNLARELGSERRETVRSLSVVGV